MLASTPVFFAVLVLLSLLAVLVSWTTMLRMSPSAAARLSPAMLRELPSCQSESARNAGGRDRRSSAPSAAVLEENEYRAFILDLSPEFLPGLEVSDAHKLAGRPAFERLHFERNNQTMLLELGFDDLAAANDGPGSHRARIERRPRLNVFKSLNGMYAQVIDDVAGHTLAAASTLDKEIKATVGLKKSDEAKEVGKLVAQRAIAKNIKKVVFDRAGYRYHGRIKAIADGAREGGLEF